MNIEVYSSQMNQIASKLDEQIYQLQNEHNEIIINADIFNEEWQGDTAQKFDQSFRDFLVQFNNYIDVLRKYNESFAKIPSQYITLDKKYCDKKVVSD